MANGWWVRSLQCKLRALDDVVPHSHANSKLLPLLPASSGCRKSAQSLKDVVQTANQNQINPRRRKHKHKRPLPRPTSIQPEPDSHPTTRRSRVPDPTFPALSELPGGHPSRNVVEIIFHTSWSPKAFSGRIEMVFKVENLPRTVARFEEYRGMVKSQAGGGDGGEDQARCVADGNEVMRFFCLGPTAGGQGYECGGGWALQSGKAGICTFSGSGEAHESAGGGRGRRAMLVCRVIAGRVLKGLGLEGRVGFNSVSGENGELLVFDSRAVLPCFLIIYKL
ncbi:uncharacterized protein LOC127813316 [Diospyros lotus]|uniref:uncharacterized protein LOC127813316 n=1 Tax=Diospyros lotus TaxID=55363 RepID=UPI0022586A2E|nr:uncharacterized protein LOC127813316 [Diospyros lotus]